MTMFPVLDESLELLHHVTSTVPTDRLDDPTPCSEWTVVQVLLHAAGDQHAWAYAVGSSSRPAYNPFAPPTQVAGTLEELMAPAIAAATAVWQQIDASAESVATPLPPVPTLPAELAAAACALDAAVHAWDVAVSTGQDSPLRPELAAGLMPAARAVVEPLRGFAYASALPERAGDDATATLLRYLGRDPNWAA